MPCGKIGAAENANAAATATISAPPPPRVVSQQKIVVAGNPDQKHISTSLVERQNLTMRMSMRRLTRLTNAFSKKFENLQAAVALHFAHYNLVRLHTSHWCRQDSEEGRVEEEAPQHRVTFGKSAAWQA